MIVGKVGIKCRKKSSTGLITLFEPVSQKTNFMNRDNTTEDYESSWR